MNGEGNRRPLEGVSRHGEPAGGAPRPAPGLTDSHVHLDGLLAGGAALTDILERARAGGVGRLLAVGGSPAANRMAVDAARRFPGAVRAAAGYDRHAEAPSDFDALDALLSLPEAAAVGEIGLDFSRGRDSAGRQQDLFHRQLDLAARRGLPVCVHTRAAEPETLAALRAQAAAWRGAADRIGVLHCFTGGPVFARALLDLGFCISFSGILTFKKSGGLRAVAAAIPASRLLIETDAPFLAPEPFRGKPCEPAHVRQVAEALAAARGTTWEAIAELTGRNAGRLFWPEAPPAHPSRPPAEGAGAAPGRTDPQGPAGIS